MGFMRLVNIDRKINVRIYDENQRTWKEHRMSIDEFLSISSSDPIPVLKAESADGELTNGGIMTTTLIVREA